MESTNLLDNDIKPLQCVDDKFILQTLLNSKCKIEDIDNMFNPVVLVKKLDIFEGQFVKVEEDIKLDIKLENEISDFDNKNIKTLNQHNFYETKLEDLCIKKEDIDSTGEINSNTRSPDLNEKFENNNLERRNIQEIQYNSEESSTTDLITKKKYVKALKFVCNYCGKNFRQSNMLRHHVRTHNGRKPHKCSLCTSCFRTKTLLKLHIQNHSGLRAYSCKVCKKGFKTLHNLQVHSEGHRGKQYICTYCSIAFSQKVILFRHMNKKHNEPNNVDISNKSQTNSSENTYECADCGECFEKKHLLKDHTNTHLNIKKFSCEFCDLKFFKSSTMYNHRRRIHVNKYGFVCYECRKVFTTKLGVQMHISTVHLKIKTITCELCKAKFTSKVNLQAHIEVHHNNDKSNKFFCNVCNQGFYRLAYLLRHSKIHSDSHKKFKCDVCDYSCRTKIDIERHVLTHFGGGDKPFSCDKCGKSFSKQSHLVRHNLVHSDERPYKCQDCDKAYKDPESLKVHMNTHAGITFTCKRCGFHSINEHSFKRHLRSC